MTKDNRLPPGLEGVLDNAAGSEDRPDGKMHCSRCGQFKEKTAFPDGRSRHLCYECMGGNTQAMPGMPRVKPLENTIICPDCQTAVDVSEDMYDHFGQCEVCKGMFFIDRPDEG